MIGTQEIIAIILVTAVVGFALYRRLRRKPDSTAACSNCDNPTPSKKTEEQPVRFFRKQR
jgi:hypothetical protein